MNPLFRNISKAPRFSEAKGFLSMKWNVLPILPYRKTIQLWFTAAYNILMIQLKHFYDHLTSYVIGE